MITIAQGLQHSFIILEFLRNDKELEDADVNVECFMNCRECGLTFTVYKDSKFKTFCIYEHRNSDDIVVNSKEKWSSFNGDLPYKGNKWEYDRAFSYNKHYDCYLYLKKRILEYV